MWRVLLVEDEVFVRESIKEIIDWEEIGFRVIAEAGNGKEALDIVKDKHPDVIITDILMPVMDGVELLKKARAAGFQSKFIMLSCMSDFEYVRQALEHGASDYILKLSMSVQSLRDTLQKVKNQLDTEVKRILQVTQGFYEQLWQELMNKKDSIDPLLDRSFLKFEDTNSLKVIVISILHGEYPFHKNDIFKLNIMEQGTCTKIHSFQKWGLTTLFVWSYSPSNMRLGIIDNVPYPVVISPVVATEEMLLAWQTTMIHLSEFWYKEEIGLLWCTQLHSPGRRNQILWETERKILQLFEQMDINGLILILQEIWDEMRIEGFSMFEVKETAKWIDKMISRIIGKGNTADEILLSSSHRQLLKIMIGRMEEKYKKWVKQKVLYTNHPEINKVMEYIQQNYTKSITVKDLARLISMDESYLSSLFKKRTGKSIIQYLHQIRINQAKYYLIHTDIPINQVCERVGFSHYNYFIKIFRRFTDQTPKKYRQQHI